MSNFNMTPFSIIDQNPLGGFRAGLGDMRAMDHSNSALATEGLQRDIYREELEKTQLNKPLDAIKRQHEMEKLEEERQMRSEGYFRRNAEIEQQQKIENMLKTKTENEIAQIKKTGEAFVRNAEYLNALGPAGESHAYMATNWEDVTRPLRDAGVKVPDAYDPKHVARIRAAAQSYVQTAEHIRNKETKAIEHENAMVQAGQKYGYERSLNAEKDAEAMKRLDKSLAAQKEIAQIREGGSGGGSENYQRELGKAVDAVNKWLVDPTAKPPSDLQLAMVEDKHFGDLRKQANDAASKDQSIQMAERQLGIKIATGKITPAEEEKARTAIRQSKNMVASNIMMEDTGYQRFVTAIKRRMDMDKKTEKSTSVPTSTADITPKTTTSAIAPENPKEPIDLMDFLTGKKVPWQRTPIELGEYLSGKKALGPEWQPSSVQDAAAEKGTVEKFIKDGNQWTVTSYPDGRKILRDHNGKDRTSEFEVTNKK